ncbi:MAG TPA: glycoside hydrolase family 30 beta sandwich domain-containing protein [Polyangiaceae bacterium]|nr:glycoside hydrolase family 30 beta sandwich domain-containing protein [Polyangiaceae bacterium]
MSALLQRFTGIALAFSCACGQTPWSTSESSTAVAGASGTASVAGASGMLQPASSASAGTAGTSAGSAGSSGALAIADDRGGVAGSAAGVSSASAAGMSGASAGAAPIIQTQVVSSASDALWKTEAFSEEANGPPDVIVDDTKTYQTFDGFGGTFNERSWSYLTLLSEGERARALNLLFGTEGARFVFGRLPIGANEFAIDRYTLDVTDDDSTPDPSMEKFSLSRDQKYLIPYVKAALALNPGLRFLAVPWTPPVWMKTGSLPLNGVPSGYDGGNMKEDATTLQAFALYLAKFVQEYGKQGITVEAIAVQREPSFADNFPSCIWTTPSYVKFVRDYLSPMFAAQGVNARVYIGLMENGEESSLDTAIVSSVKADAQALKAISGFGFEWGMIKQMARVTSLNLPVIQTEHQPGNFPWLSTFQRDKPPNDYAYAIESWGLIRDWLKAGATAYIAKHMVLDSVGLGLDSQRIWPQNSLLVVDTETRALTVTPAFYVFDHFSHFVVPGAKRIDVTSTTLDALAFKNPDGSIVTVMHNSDSSSKQLTTAVGGSSIQFTIPANGFATLLKAP